MLAARITSGLGQLICLGPIHPAGVGEEQQPMMCRGDEEVLHHVVAAQCRTLDAAPTATLCTIGVGAGALGITTGGDGDDHILFGDMLGILTSDLVETGLIALFATAFLVVLRKDLLAHAFDPQHAQAIGLSVRLLHYGQLAVLSLVVVGALKAVGIILSVAMLVAPGAIAFLLTKRYATMLVTAVIVAVSSSLAGIYLSFFIDSAPAPTIVLIMSGIFIVTFVVGQIRSRTTEASV